jgi:hypothetical protein
LVTTSKYYTPAHQKRKEPISKKSFKIPAGARKKARPKPGAVD